MADYCLAGTQSCQNFIGNWNGIKYIKMLFGWKRRYLKSGFIVLLLLSHIYPKYFLFEWVRFTMNSDKLQSLLTRFSYIKQFLCTPFCIHPAKLAFLWVWFFKLCISFALIFFVPFIAPWAYFMRFSTTYWGSDWLLGLKRLL